VANTFTSRAIAARNSLQSKRSKECKRIDITSVHNVPDTIPEGKAVGNYQTPLFSMGMD